MGMTRLKFHGQDIHTRGSIPDIGSWAHDFNFVKLDLSEVNFYSFKQKHRLLNIFPSIDTVVCATSVKKFQNLATEVGEASIINLSMDLPFAQKRFSAAEGISNVYIGSLFRSDFFTYYPLDIIDGPLKGLCSRCIIIVNEKNEIIYTEQVMELSNEPNYEEAIIAINS